MARKAAITVNVSKQLKGAVEERARECDRSVSNYLLQLIKADLKWPQTELVDDELKAAAPTPESLAALALKAKAAPIPKVPQKVKR